MISIRPALLSLSALLLFSSSNTAWADDTPDAAKQDADFAVQGEYVRASDGMGAQVVATGDGEFRLFLLTGGLPGAGWSGAEKRELNVDAEEATDILEDFKKVERKSPTLGLTSPQNAVVLFDGTRETFEAHWQQPVSRMTDDGLLMEGAVGIDRFQDYSMHLEFRTPFEPKDSGQARGNSGVYHQGRYEVQVLDSFGLTGEDNEAGGLYGLRKPNVNMCLPPLTWQTYDFDFVAARFKDGQKISPAKVTVRLNGVVVHRDVELPKLSAGSLLPDDDQPGSLFLQNHGDPVRYRNIWVQPRNFDALARRPVIPAFERFHAEYGSDATAGGHLLLGELNCLSCHQAAEEYAAFLTPRKAPRLDRVAERLHPEWMIDFISSPHVVKAGTTMPDVMAGLTAEMRREAAVSLVTFLVGEKQILRGGNSGNVQHGRRLFNEVGCAACHQTRGIDTKVSSATSVPLVGLEQKYSFASLERFLKDPAAVRPSSRMPHLGLSDNDTRSVVQFLLGDAASIWPTGNNVDRPKSPNMAYRLYYDSFSKLPDFSKRKPDKTGTVAGFDFRVSERQDNFAVCFDGFLPVIKAGKYTFRTRSDDGSALYIGETKVVDNDGVHPGQVREGTIRLEPGVHPVRVEFFEAGGGEELNVYWAGPDMKGTTLDSAVVMTRDETEIIPEEVTETEDKSTEYVYTYDADRAKKGRELFAALGCASCHERTEDNTQIPSLVKAPVLAECRPSGGCLSQSSSDPVAGLPVFDLSDEQVTAINAAITSGPPVEVTDELRISHTMKSFNCYACHIRGAVGGPESDRNPLFKTTIPEMGDEGRLPPPLDGVGDKLNEGYLKNVMASGANERAYMHTQMPKFGEDATRHLVSAFARLDQKMEVELPQMSVPDNRLASTGRKLAGDKGFSCVKCHTFGKFKATGIQAIGLEKMASRLREDWFHRYLIDPGKYRPGTRMPTAFPNGKSVVRDVLSGHSQQQLAAMWAYLEKGLEGGVPDGITGGMIELKPAGRPILYRNFLEGLSSRGIAVGYPEKANLAWDADRLALSLLWQGRFMDASMHWQGRGQGRQRPLGDNIIKWETVVPVAILETVDTPWPEEEPRERGYRFSGYRLDKDGRPSFRYRTHSFTVQDTPVAVADKEFPYFARRILVSSEGDSDLDAQPEGQLYFRAIRDSDVKRQDDGSWLVRGAIRVTVHSDKTQPVERTVNGQTEVLIPLAQDQLIEQQIAW